MSRCIGPLAVDHQLLLFWAVLQSLHQMQPAYNFCSTSDEVPAMVWTRHCMPASWAIIAHYTSHFHNGLHFACCTKVGYARYHVAQMLRGLTHMTNTEQLLTKHQPAFSVL